MSGRPGARPVLRAVTTYLATLATAFALSSALAGPANADPPDSNPTSTTETTEPPSSTPTAEPSPSEPSSVTTEPSEPPPAEPPAEAAETPELEVTAAFDRPAYHTGDPITVTLRIKNVGSTRVAGITAHNRPGTPTELSFDSRQWGDLGRGVTIEPGATHETSLSGHQGDTEADSVTLIGNVFHNGLGVHEFSFQAPVTKRFGHAGGIVYGDGNGNGEYEPGEELSSVTVTLFYGGRNTYTATTDAAGRFSFPMIPTVRYFSGGTAPDGWLVASRIIEIDESDRNDDLRIRAVKPITGKLRVGLEFTKDSYQPGELAHVTVTLNNTGSTSLSGIVANCNRAGFGHGLEGTGPGWGALGDFFGEGVTIVAGETKTINVSEKVPDVAIDTGHVFVGCDFGYSGVDDSLNHPSAFDTAKVPGGIASVVGEVLFYPEGSGAGKPSQGVAGVRLVLVDKRPCPIVAETTTDGNGHFEVHNLAPGPDYLLYVLPPPGWRVTHDNPTSPEVRGNSNTRLFIEVEPGDGDVPTLPTQPESCGPTTSPAPTSVTPAPQARSSSGLASTGASVIGLGALGLVALVLGVGVVLGARRRRSTS